MKTWAAGAFGEQVADWDWGGGGYRVTRWLMQGRDAKKNGGCSCRGNSSLTCMVFKHLLHHSFPKTERLAQHVDHIFCLLSICRLFFLLETSTK